MMYLAAQYLAAAGISFLDKEADDSHTNLEFVIGDASLNSRPLSAQGDRLSINFEKFTLNWENSSSKAALRLDGITHAQVLQWINEQLANTSINKEYLFKFHYDLPYEINESFAFRLLDAGRLRELTHLRILAQLAMEELLRTQELSSQIRVWPHHFDTGIYAIDPKDRSIAVGAGLAIPDSVVNEHYFYLSIYRNNKAIPPEQPKSLSLGRWHTEGFVGAVLPAKDQSVKSVLSFYQQATKGLLETS